MLYAAGGFRHYAMAGTMVCKDGRQGTTLVRGRRHVLYERVWLVDEQIHDKRARVVRWWCRDVEGIDRRVPSCAYLSGGHREGLINDAIAAVYTIGGMLGKRLASAMLRLRVGGKTLICSLVAHMHGRRATPRQARAVF